MKQGAIFDMDGLLFDTEVVYNQEWYKLAKVYKLTINPMMLDKLRGTSGKRMHQIIKSYWPHVDVEKLCKELFENAQQTMQTGVPMKPGVLEVLKYFKANAVKMAVASSAPFSLIMNNLNTADITIYFDAIISGQHVQQGKPAPDIFLLAASKLELLPEDCYVFEDGLHGVKAGICAGCFTIMIPDLVLPNEEVYESSTVICSSLLEVLDALKQKLY